VLAQEGLQRTILLRHRRRETDQFRRPMHVVQATGSGDADTARGFRKQVSDLCIDHAPDGFMDPAAAGDAGEFRIDFRRVAGEQAHFLQLFQGEHAGAQSIVDIMVVVGDFVGEIAYLRFERRTTIVFESACQVRRVREPAPGSNA
jgi:hypothetical protein